MKLLENLCVNKIQYDFNKKSDEIQNIIFSIKI